MLDFDIREQIRRYVAGEIDAGDLEEWITGDPEALIADEPLATRQLLADTARLVFERMNGDWSDVDLKVRLGAMSNTYWFHQAPKVVWGDSDSSVTLHHQWSGVAGRSPVTGCA
jgi:hypothetical protein